MKYSINGIADKLEGIYNLFYLMYSSDEDDPKSIDCMFEVLLSAFGQEIEKLREIDN